MVMLEARGLAKRYGRRNVLRDASLTICAGEEHFRYFSAARKTAQPWRDIGLDLARRCRFEPWWWERVENLSEGTKQNPCTSKNGISTA